MTEKEVAKQIRVSLASLRRWRLLQRGPRFVKVGALVRYRPEDLEEWMETLPTGGTDFSAAGNSSEAGIGVTAAIAIFLAHIILIG
jgi:excisionase family DNA binding protein